ncbi:uncharacterized protein LOC124341678 [Daphnia pulicaria]|uniref:uncharacterized protein LOC124341678 n=1 Tax=Daphnia pulicaria TaxID=35523 RepID=UPI001EEC3211|nr:uncharacterized protein LOC124341678 [Daphnia pulicaria]
MNLSVLIISSILAGDIVCGVVGDVGTTRFHSNLGRNLSVGTLRQQNIFEQPWMSSFFNFFAPFINSFNAIRRPNPGRNYTQADFTSCQDPDGLIGNCLPATVCKSYGGRPSGSCRIAAVCCINLISKCGEKMTLNNTEWRNPPGVSSDSSCSLIIALDRDLVEQRGPTCQVRLDFKTFAIAQPNASTSQCDTGYFQVGGVVNDVPLLCGDNDGQHMYLEAPSSKSDLLLLFKFGGSTLNPKWNITISLIPCGSDLIASRDCLQYFVKGSNTVKSFNWKDTTGTRQLSKMNYKICFRNELVNNQRATRICYTQCTTQAGGRSFLLSGPQTGNPASKSGAINCPHNFLLIRNGFNPLLPTAVYADRYCGGALNPAAFEAPAVTVCSTTKDFNIIYYTNDAEDSASHEDGNAGFCLVFEQILA